ncbi:MAG: PAS domain-containing protein [Tabrizicola sp.]
MTTVEPGRLVYRVVELMNRLLDVTPANADAEIGCVLAALGEAGDFARTFVFRFDPLTGYRNTHEWIRPGVPALKPCSDAQPAHRLPAWQARFEAGQTVTVPDLDHLPEGSAERHFLWRIEARSALMVPLMDGARLIGVIGFDSVCRKQTWPRDSVFLLESIGRAVSSALLRIEAGRDEAPVCSHLAATLHALPGLAIELSPSGRIVACHGDRLPSLAGLVRTGIGLPLEEVLPEPLSGVLADLLADPPADTAELTRCAGLSTLAAPHGYEVSVARLPPAAASGEANLLVVIRDSSVAERFSQMLSFREGQFTAFFEMSPHAILVNDFDSAMVLDGNRAFREMFGLDPQAGRDVDVRRILPEESAWVLDQSVAALKATGSYGPVEARFRRADGTAFPAITRCFLSVDPDGRRLVWSLIEDVTEVREKEAALQAESQALAATKARLLAAIEALDDGFAVFDADDRLVLWNRPYVRVFSRIADLICEGALYDDLLRAAIDRGVFGAEGERDEENLQRRLNRPLTEVWDNEDKFADGRLIWVRERATPARETVGLYEDVTARRLADRRLQQVVDGGEIAVWDWDAGQGFSAINNRWGAMLGLDQTVGLDAIIDLVHPEDRIAVATVQRQVFLEGSDDFSLRCRMRHANGRWLWLLTRGHVALRWADGSPRRISGITLDVSTQAEAEQRLSQVIDGTKVGTWEHDLRTGVTLVSDRWAEIIGYQAVEINPLPLSGWLGMLHPDDAEALIAHEREAFEAGEWQVEHEVRLRHRQGHWVWVLTRAQVSEWDEAGHPVRTSGINLDITPSKALESALARERDTLARVMEASVSGIVVVDEKGDILFSNAAAARVLGRAVGPGDSLLDLLAAAEVRGLEGEPLDPADLPVARALSGQPGMHELRHRLVWPTGATRHVAVTSARLSAAGADLAVVCTFTDITDEMEAEARLRAAMTAAETANRAKSNFLAAMSHEIRTPLNGVLGMATVLSGRLTDPTEQAMVRVISDSGEHLLGVINDILDLAKIEAGRMVLDPRPIRLAEVLFRVTALHQVAADEKGIRLQARCIGGSAEETRLGDEKRLIQILHNLIGNALKFTDRGEVRVEIDCSDPGSIVVRVSCTGIGMSQAEIARAFDEFSQGMGGSRRSHVGTGLGLPIVRRLARLMGGDVALTSVQGQGVTARVWLKVPVLDRTSDRSGNSSALRLPGVRVLAAEDNATNRIILQSMLHALGVEAVIVEDGTEAIERFRNEDFDAVLLDIAMPVMDGIETLDALTNLARALGKPLPRAVAVTANVMTHQVEHYLGRGFSAVVAKPIRLEMLGAALDRTLTPALMRGSG